LISDRYASLSAGHRKAAEFILSSPHEAAMMTLEEMAEKTGISPATINRLGTKLGLSGYQELKRLLRSELQQALRPVEDFVEALRVQRLAPTAPWSRSLEEDMERIRNVQAIGGDAAFARASTLLAKARRLFFVGFGSSAFVAQYAAFCFSSIRGNCEAVTDSSGIEGGARKIVDAGEEDAALQIGFARYSDHSLRVAEKLSSLKVPLICVTDGPRSPFVRLAAETFLVERKSGFLVTGSGTGGVAVVEALVHGTAAALGLDEIERRSTKLTSLLGDTLVVPEEGL
jgi:DNA-binding MurR/RpiR family transcriptional regulator